MSAADLFWDANGNTTTAVGGTGNWTGGSTWRAGSSTGTLQLWADGSSANFPASSTITLNANVATPAITNTGTGLIQLVGSGGNSIDFGAGGFFVSPGVTPSMRTTAKLKGVVTVVATGATSLANTAGIWIKADNSALTSFTASGTSGNSVIVDDAGAFGPAATSTLLLTNGITVHLGALSSETIGATSGGNIGINFNAVPTTLGGGYIRPRAGASTWNGPITLTANNSGFISRIAAGVSLTCSSTATINLNTFTLDLNADSTSSGFTLNGVISGSGNIQTTGTSVTGAANGQGTTTLGAANTFTGTATTAQNLGTLALNNVNALQNATLNTGASSGSQAVTFVVAGNNTYNLGALTGSDDLAIGGNTLSVGAKTVDTTFSAVISGSGGKLTKVGANKLTLAASPAYDGLTTISAGTLALNGGVALAPASSVSLAAGATLDVSASATYNWGASASLTASGTGTTAGTTAAEIKGGTTVDLGSRPVTLNFTPTSFSGDATHPALYVSSGALAINSAITVNNAGASPLGNGTYILIRVVGGSSSGTPTLSGVVGGNGVVSGKVALLQRNGTTGDIELAVQDALVSTTTIARNISTVASTTYGDTLQFDASVTGAGPTPTGTVELRDGGAGGTLVGTGTLSGGTCTLTPAVNALSATTHANIVAVYTGDATYSASTSAALSPAQVIAQKALTVSGASASSKYFDTTTTVTITGGSLVGVVSGDSGNVTLNQSGTFVSAGPGTSIGVTGTSTLSGSASANYSLTAQPSGLSADIYAAGVWNGTAADTLWNSAGNWTPFGFPSGANVAADFTTLDITTDQTVNLNSARTIGNLKFGDSDTNTAAGWTLANNGTAGNTLTLGGTTPTVTVNALGAGKVATIGAVVAGTSGLTKTGNGVLTLSAANSYSGGTVIKSGALAFNADSGLGAVPGSATPGNITLDGGMLALTAFDKPVSANRGVYVTSNGGAVSNAYANSTGNLYVNGIIDGPGALTVGVAAQAGVLLQAQNTHSGGTILSGAANGNVFCMQSSAGPAGAPTSGTFGTGTVTFNGPGTRSPTGADTVVGNPIVFAADTAFPTLSSEKSLTFNGPITLSNATRTLTVSIGATVSGKSLTLEGAIGDGGNGYGLTKAGSGVLTISGNNTYSGNTTINGGILALAHTNGLGASQRIAIANVSGATLRIDVPDSTSTSVGAGKTLTNNNSGASFFGALQGGASISATWAGNVVLGSDASRIGGGSAGTLTVSGVISEATPGLSVLFSRAPNSTTLLANQNTFTGDAQLFMNTSTTTLKMGTNNAIHSASRVTLSAATSGTGYFDLNGYNQNIRGLMDTVTGDLVVTNSSTTVDAVLTLTETNVANTSTFGGWIQDGASRKISVVKAGAGKQEFTGANNYTGDTTVSGGTLLVNSPGSLAAGSAVTVNGSGTLGGNGTVNGGVTVQSGGTLAPGIAVGQLNLGSTLTFSTGATGHFELTNSLAADKAAVVGAVTYAGKLKLERAAGATLANGSYDLFDGASFSGAFTQLELVNWDVTKRVSQASLTTDGTIVLANNAAPVAQNITAGVALGGAVTLPVIGGKHGATDADGDSLIVTALGVPTSGSVSFGSNSVTYIASGSTGTNTFTYTVTDPFGAADTKTVAVIVSSPLGFNQVSAGVDGGNAVLTYLGIPGLKYSLDITHDVPATNWIPVLTNTASATGYLNFTNPISLSPTNDFYRTRHVP